MHPGGIYLNWGSAVLLPEVFLKAVSVARNLGVPLQPITTANFDFIQHYRPLPKCSEASDRIRTRRPQNGIARLRHHRPSRTANAFGRRRAGRWLAKNSASRQTQTMSLLNENSFLPPDQEPPSQSPVEPGSGASQPPTTPAELPLAGDPISFAATVPAPVPSYKPPLPEDLRISWSWLHFALFLSFVVVSFFIVQLSFRRVLLCAP